MVTNGYFKKAENTSKGFCKLVSTMRCRYSHDVNLFSRERILTKVKIFPKRYKNAVGKYPDLLKESFTLQNFPDSKVFGFPTLNSGFKISGDATKPERFYCGFVRLGVNSKTNPVPKRSGFVMNPEKSPLV